MTWDNDRVAEAVRRVEAMLNGDPLRSHTALTPEQFALDSKLMATQVVGNVLGALEGRGDPEGASDPLLMAKRPGSEEAGLSQAEQSALEEARDIMAQMTRYMTFSRPGQGPFSDVRERDRLWTEFQAWEAAAFPEEHAALRFTSIISP